MSDDFEPLDDYSPRGPAANNAVTDSTLHFCLDLGIGSKIDGLAETSDGWSLNSFQISKKWPVYTAGYTFSLSPTSRLYKRWFDFPDLGKKGWALIFRRWDQGDNPSHPGLEESLRGWVPPEREKEADHWIAFLNQEIRARLREAGQTPTEPDPAHGAIPPPAPPGPIPVPPLLSSVPLSQRVPAGLARQRQEPSPEPPPSPLPPATARPKPR